MDSIFRHGKGAYPDFSLDLRDEQEWKTGTLSEFKYFSRVSAVAVDSLGGLLAVGKERTQNDLHRVDLFFSCRYFRWSSFPVRKIISNEASKRPWGESCQTFTILCVSVQASLYWFVRGIRMIDCID